MRTNVMIAAAIAALVIIAGAAYIALSNQAPSTQDNTTEAQGWALSGVVYDQNKVAVPGATVTIYKAVRDNATGAWTNGEKLNVRGTPGLPNSGNPQLTNDGSTAAPGSYMFSAVPAGAYNVTAEKDGSLWYADVQWGQGSPNVDIAIPDYSYMPGTATVMPGTLSPAPAQGPWATVTGTVTDDDGLPVSNATVTLWAVGRDRDGKEVNLGKAIVSDDPRNNSSASANPVLSSDGSRAAQGTYVFYRAPWGLYNVTAEKDGKLWSTKVIVGQGGMFGTAICNVGGVVWSPDRIEGFGTISGIVTDQNKVGIPNASMTLWNVRWNSTSERWENTNPAKVKDNPQSTNNGSTGAVGMYTFYMVPWSAYNVTAEKDGHTWYSLLLLGPSDAYSIATYIPGSEYGTATHNIAIPDYSIIQ
jgi:protocatechuate 3,4-dioxygenase beta subunit